MNPARGGVDQPGDDAAVERLERIARLLDAQFAIPGTRFRFGLDPLLGLLPGFGDGAMALASLWIVYEAHRLGVSRAVLGRMLGNVALDAVIGVVPIVGDLFDASYRANLRNVALLRRSLRGERGRPRRGEPAPPS